MRKLLGFGIGDSMADGIESLQRAIGRIEGRLVALEDSLKDERTNSREEHKRIATKLEILEDRLMQYTATQDSIQVQTYSNKQGLEGISKDLKALQTVYSKGLGALAVLSLGGSMLVTGIWWALTHMSDLFMAIRSLAKP